MTSTHVPTYIDALIPYQPGKPIEEVEREIGVVGAIKLASNENAWGPSPQVAAAISREASRLHLYPDGGAFYLKRDLAAHLGVDASQLIVGNGSNELIELLIRTFLETGDNVVTSACAFVAYKISTKAAGYELREAPLGAGMAYDLDAVAQQVNARTRLIFLANPNNPTGTCFTEDALTRFVDTVDAAADAGGYQSPIIVLDEAYLEYVRLDGYQDSLAWVAKRPRTVVLRTFSKAYGLASLRVGYGVATPDLIDYMNRIRLPFNVSALAQVAARAALSDQPWLTTVVSETVAERDAMTSELNARGFGVIPSQTNFLLVHMGGPAGDWYQKLLERGVITRPMRPYGLTEHLRISVGLPVQNARLYAALDALRAE